MIDLGRLLFDPVKIQTVAVVISRTPHGNLHIGIAQRDSDKTRMLDLAWVCRLEDEALESSHAFPNGMFIVPDFEFEEEGDFLLTMCRRIPTVPENRGITYCLGSFPHPEAYFDENGIFRTSDPRYGLNCATFVARVFQDGKYPLLRIEEWPRREADRQCQEGLVVQLERALREDPTGSITQAKVDFVQSQIGTPRIRPHEVAGACLEARGALPIGFALGEPNGHVVHAILRRIDAEFAIPSAFTPPTMLQNRP